MSLYHITFTGRTGRQTATVGAATRQQAITIARITYGATGTVSAVKVAPAAASLPVRTGLPVPGDPSKVRAF